LLPVKRVSRELVSARIGASLQLRSPTNMATETDAVVATVHEMSS
jgi:hypothetical protein